MDHYAFKNNFPDLVFSNQICKVLTSAMVTAPFFSSWFYAFAWGGNLTPNPKLLTVSSFEWKLPFILTHTFHCTGLCVLHPPSQHEGDLNVRLFSALLRHNAWGCPLSQGSLGDVRNPDTPQPLSVCFRIPMTPQNELSEMEVRRGRPGTEQAAAFLAVSHLPFRAIFPWEKPW